jgi:uncharacterized protein YqfB (UPF0267 family)
MKMKVCDCERNMADKIVDYCQREIKSKEKLRDSIVEKHYKEIEQIGIDALKRVINRISIIADKQYNYYGDVK